MHFNVAKFGDLLFAECQTQCFEFMTNDEVCLKEYILLMELCRT